MAFTGRKFKIFGSFSRKQDAIEREREGKNRFIIKRKTMLGDRYIVLKRRRGRAK